jgi:hypothetical protein
VHNQAIRSFKESCAVSWFGGTAGKKKTAS